MSLIYGVFSMNTPFEGDYYKYLNMQPTGNEEKKGLSKFMSLVPFNFAPSIISTTNSSRRRKTKRCRTKAHLIYISEYIPFYCPLHMFRYFVPQFPNFPHYPFFLRRTCSEVSCGGGWRVQQEQGFYSLFRSVN